MRMRAVALTIFAMLFASAVFGQGTQSGILRGTARGPDGLTLPGASVSIKSPALQGERMTTTELDGTFLFRGLPPGLYTVTFVMSAMANLEQTVEVPLGGIAEVDVTMKFGGVTEMVSVETAAPTILTTPTVGANITQTTVEALANRRDLAGIANLSPAVTESTAPNNNQLNINGSFAYDNMFMINGVDVNDNLFGSPHNVFIEDAIQETQVLTSGIPAEYGRFSGGVINAVTKSGGNLFSGSFRTNFSNPTWSTKTPYEVLKKVTIADKLSETYEATFGGPIVRDMLWFFTAGRLAKTETSPTLPVTGIGYSRTLNNKRGELKFTGSPIDDHTVQVNYINNPTTEGPRPAIGSYEIDPHTLITRNTDNNILGVNWRGVLGTNVFAEAQWSRRKFAFLNAGGTSTAMVDSPIWSLNQGAYLYNAPYFDANDPEWRNNRQISGNLAYNWLKAGRHDLKGGYEWYRSFRTGGNSQSATGYVYDADYKEDANGLPINDSNGYMIPVWVPGESYNEHWMPTLGAEMASNTHSFYIQDHWVANDRLSFDLGLRYERVRAESTGGIISVDTDTVVPRLAAAFDAKGDGRLVFHATYGHYAGRYNDAQIGANSAVGNPAVTNGLYTGPAGEGRNFAPALNPANYEIFTGEFPLANISIADGLSAPIAKEFTLSAGGQLGSRGTAQVTYVWRKLGNFIEDFIDIANGTTTVVEEGLEIGEFTNQIYKNTDVPKRDYQGMVFQGSYRLRPNWQVAGNYTLQLKNEGNFAGEAANQPGISTIYGDYPGANGVASIYDPARHYPDGRLYDYQRSKLRLWTIYNFGLGRWGNLTASGLVRADSGLTYSHIATSQPLTSIQRNLLARSGYPDGPTSQSVYFGERGSQSFKGYGLLDTSINYDIPVFKTLRPWLKFDVYNLLNNKKLISWNTTVRQDAASAKDSLGLATGYTKGTLYGQATGTGNYPLPFQGQTGGRTYLVALGLRF